jgi:hypothetical protein
LGRIATIPALDGPRPRRESNARVKAYGHDLITTCNHNMEKETPPPRGQRGLRMTASRAKAEHGLTEADLAALDCEVARNPHYRTAPPMRLYLIAEVKAAAAAKRAAAPTPEQLALAREREQAQRRERAQEERRRAADRVGALVAAASARGPLGGGDTPLSIPAWTDVLRALARTDAVRDACLAARDVCAAALACRDLRLAAQQVLMELSSSVVGGGDSQGAGDAKAEEEEEKEEALLGVRADVATALVAPSTLTVPRLKRVAAALGGGLCVGGTKPQLVERILGAVRLSAPGRPGATPVALLLEARRQRAARVDDHPPTRALVVRLPSQMILEERSLLSLLPCLSSISSSSWTIPCERPSKVSAWTARRAVARVFPDEAALEAAVAAHLERRRAALLERQRAAAAAAEAARRSTLHCSCGNSASLTCRTRMCRRCCVASGDCARCPRHRMHH